TAALKALGRSSDLRTCDSNNRNTRTMRLHTSTLARLALGAALPISALAAATQPMPIRAVAPELGSAFASESGAVRVLARVDETGSVTDAAIDSSSNEALNALALEAIRSWSFAPAMEDGRPVAAKVIQPFFFNTGAVAFAK